MSDPDLEREVDAEPEDDEVEKVPFGFALTLIAIGLYLGWRLVEGIVWLVQRL